MKHLHVVFLFMLAACQQYGDPEPIDNALPKELNVEASQVWVRIYNLTGSFKIKFTYQGSEYEATIESASASSSNSIAEVSTGNIITARPPEFTTVKWSEESESGELYWGNSFGKFEPYSFSIFSIVEINPGAKYRASKMLGANTITISVDPTITLMVFSQSEYGSFNSEAYSNIYINNPQNLIDNTHAVLRGLKGNECYTSIKKL